MRALCEKSPDKLKQALEKMIDTKKTLEYSDLFKTTFMYFFELMGVRNEASMKVLIDFVLVRNSKIDTGLSKTFTAD